jgi:hypothetical protein
MILIKDGSKLINLSDLAYINFAAGPDAGAYLTVPGVGLSKVPLAADELAALEVWANTASVPFGIPHTADQVSIVRLTVEGG